MSFNVQQPYSGPTYDPVAVQPMRDELNAVGIRDLMTPEEVDATLDKPGSALVVVNSVCGCAAGNARPGVMLALQNKVIPDHLATVFAGQEKAAVNRARERMTNIPPSSPAIALFKDGELVFMLQRHHIEGHSAQQVAAALVQAFDKFCTAQGPSVSPEELGKLSIFKGCGSSIPFAS